QATVCGVCRAKIGGLALHFGVESAKYINLPPSLHPNPGHSSCQPLPALASRDLPYKEQILFNF
ncbi:hypothetical protein, partial [Erwinia sp. V71]|uniref:hypothetical protein n=1 Tax=Erwinia sp. V71 TaxID=3369424 RepID=UPI003F635A95